MITKKYPDGAVTFHRSMDGKVGLYEKYHIHYTEIPIHIFRGLFDLMDLLNEDGFLEKITCPAFVIQAKDDETAVPGSGPEIMRRIRSEDKELYAPEKGGHVIVLNHEGYEAFARTVAFLDRH